MNSPSEIASPNEVISAIERRAKPLHTVICVFVTAAVSEALLHWFIGMPWTFFSALGRVLFSGIVLYVIHHFCLVSFRLYKPSIKNLVFTMLMVCLGSALVASFALVAMSLASYLSVEDGIKLPIDTFYFAIPFAASALLVQSMLGLHYALVSSLSTSVITSLYVQRNPVLDAFAFATSLIGCLTLIRSRSRTAFTRAGFNISIAAFLLTLSLQLAKGNLISIDSLVELCAALVGGALSSFIASGIAPIVEHLGGYVTDVRLLEMATIDHPLLKDLSVQAPGTWNHSMVMGMMAEAAADAIGVSPVLSRVGAYFHDIGKIKKPLYYVENQQAGDNRHDKLSPSMSALIIRSHVKDGLELARKHNLPKAIQDMVPQHHGTSRIEYFYDKARKEAEEAGSDPDSVDESLYTYPGPKPQTREAGILMLADGIEAAARTLTEPNHDRIQGLVQKMINKVFSSGELDECELTLRDLHNIAKVFTRVLNGIYHQRIAYAEPAEKVRSQETSKEESSEEVTTEKVEGGSSDKKGRVAGERTESEENGREDLKRLGLQ